MYGGVPHPSARPFFFFQAEDGIRDLTVTGVQTCALPIYARSRNLADPGAGTNDRTAAGVSLAQERRMKINLDLNLGTDSRRAAALAVCFTIFLPLATGLVIAIASPTTVTTHGVFGYFTVPIAIWLYGVIFEPWLAIPIAILFAASFVPLYSRLGHKYPWQWIFALGGAIGL